MGLRTRLWFGPLAAVTLLLGIFGLGLLVPGYDQVRQTVSEIGEVGSPARIPFTIMLCTVAAFLLIFASALKETSRDSSDSALVAYFVGFMGISAAGVGLFAYPNAMHNLFGMSELIGYQAPLVLALTWRRHTWSSVVRFSWLMYALTILAIGANLSVLDRNGALWTYEKPVYGIVQRALFAVWFFWCAGTALLLLRRAKPGRPFKNSW